MDSQQPDIENKTCGQFTAMSDAEQRAFVLGVANGRGMTTGLLQAYAAAAQDMARSPEEQDAIARGYETIYGMMSPLLELDAASLINGIRVACGRPELRDGFVISALASVHIDAARALKEHREQTGQ